MSTLKVEFIFIRIFTIYFSFIDDTSKYVNVTVDEVDNFAIHNLDELTSYFDSTLEVAGESITDLVADTLNDIHFEEIKNITNFINDTSVTLVTEDTEVAISLLNDLNGDVTNIEDNVKAVIIGLEEIKEDVNCVLDCKTIINQLVTSIGEVQDNLTSFTTIDDAIDSISQVNDSIDLKQIQDMVQLINGAEESLNEFSDDFVNNFTKGISNDINAIADDVRNQITNLTSELKKIDLNNTDAVIYIGDSIDSLEKYTDYILYATMVPAIILGIALLLSCFGLILGKYQATRSSMYPS